MRHQLPFELDGHEIQSGIVTAAGECSDASINVESCFQVQSISKSFTAAGVLRLVGAGKLMLDAPLSEWLEDVPNAARITIRRCLQHISDLSDYGAHLAIAGSLIQALAHSSHSH